MPVVTKTKGTLSVKAYPGDFKTLLAFNFSDKKMAKNLAGFTLQTMPKGEQAYYIQNSLQFQTPGDHAQDAKEPPNSSINDPIHKFRWLHVPGSVHQGTEPVIGSYTYTVTPRYFDSNASLQPLNADLSVTLVVNVEPFRKARQKKSWVPARVACQVSDRVRVQGRGRFGSRTIFSW
jgi:hypothetical protein